MNRDLRKLFENHPFELSEQVTAERLKRAGVVLGNDLGLQRGKSKPRTRYPASIVKTLAGG
jgi:hypothetical protein